MSGELPEIWPTKNGNSKHCFSFFWKTEKPEPTKDQSDYRKPDPWMPQADVVVISAALTACAPGAAWVHALRLLRTAVDAALRADVVAYGAEIAACENLDVKVGLVGLSIGWFVGFLVCLMCWLVDRLDCLSFGLFD